MNRTFHRLKESTFYLKIICCCGITDSTEAIFLSNAIIVTLEKSK